MLKMASSSRASPPREEQRSLLERHTEGGSKQDGDRFDQETSFGKRRLGEEGMKLDQERLEKALKEEKKRKSSKKEPWEEEMDGRKRRKMGAGAMGDTGFDVTEEEMEAYRMNKISTEDPMANYVDQDDL